MPIYLRRGSVLKADGTERATVRLLLDTGCSSCDGHAGCCGAFGKPEQTLTASNSPGAAVGEEVEVALYTVNRALAVLLAFILPVAGLGGGAFLGAWWNPLGDPEASGGLLAFAGLALVGAALAWLFRKGGGLAHPPDPAITRVLKRAPGPSCPGCGQGPPPREIHAKIL